MEGSNSYSNEWEKTVELSQTIIENLEIITHKKNINKEIKEDLEDLLTIIKIKLDFMNNFLEYNNCYVCHTG